MRKNEMLTAGQRKAIWAIGRGELHLDRDGVHEAIGKNSVNDLTKIEAKEMIEILKKLAGQRERNWYQACEERFFLQPGVKSINPVRPAQMRLIIHLAGQVFEHSVERFAGFLLKRKRAKRIVTYWQAVEIIETLKSMSNRKGKVAK